MDEKVSFYIRHRDQIEEWAKLRELAATALVDALMLELDQLAEEQPGDFRMLADNVAALWFGDHTVAHLRLTWMTGALFKPTASYHAYPYAGIILNGKRGDRLFDTVKLAAGSVARQHNLTQSETNWPLWGPMRPMSSDEDVNDYAREVVEKFQAVWLGLRDVVASAIERAGTEPQA